MKEPKYAVYPGPMISKTDRQRHHISASQLIGLYGVDPEECLVIFEHFKDRPEYKHLIKRAEKLIPLFPMYNGDYRLPTC